MIIVCAFAVLILYRKAEHILSEKRIEWIDVLKGIGIILVILEHTHVLFRTYIFSFHMPLFFFISGYLFTIDRYKNFAEFACKKVKSILVPYLFLCIVSLILAFIVSGSETNPLEFVKQIVISKRNAMPVNPTLWFLTCLFAIELLFYLLTRALKNDLIKSGFIIVLSLLGFNVSLNATLPFSFNLSLYYLLFYLIGNLPKKVKDNHAVKYIGFACLGISIVLLIYPSYFDVLQSTFETKGYYVSYVYSVLIAMIGILGCMSLSRILVHSQYLKRLGQNTILIFAIHIFILDGAYYLLTSLGLTVNQGYNIYGVTITIVCLIVLKPIIQFINNYFGMFLGKLPFKAKNDVDCHQTLP